MQIEKGVPVPHDAGQQRRKYPWPEMKKGDSFFLDGCTQAAGEIAQNGNRWADYHGYTRRFSGRAVDGGVRVWRIK